MAAEKQVRPKVLWICAAILGIAAGLNFYRLSRANLGPVSIPSGFESRQEYGQIAELLDNADIKSLTTGQVSLLDRLSNGPGITSHYVLGILANIHNDQLAQSLLPIADKATKKNPSHPIALNLPENWVKNGCPVASKMLIEHRTGDANGQKKS